MTMSTCNDRQVEQRIEVRESDGRWYWKAVTSIDGKITNLRFGPFPTREEARQHRHDFDQTKAFSVSPFRHEL